MPPSHATILNDESDAALGRVKKYSWGEDDKTSIIVGEGLEAPFPLPSPLISKWRTWNICLLQGFAATKTPALQTNQVDFGICDIALHPLVNYSLFKNNQVFFLERFRPNQICNFATILKKFNKDFLLSDFQITQVVFRSTVS